MTEAIVAEISSKEPSPTQQDGTYKLLFYDKETGESHYVYFRDRHTVNLCVLDMCAYQSDGVAKLAIDKTCPPNVIPAWKIHHEKLCKQMGKLVNRFERLAESGAKGQELKDIKRIAIPKSSNDNLFQGGIELTPTKIISYKVKRVRRLNQPRAGALLTQFAKGLMKLNSTRG